MKKYAVYAKFIVAFILWTALISFTKLPIFGAMADESLRGMRMPEVGFFVLLCFVISTKYIVTLGNIGSELFTNPRRIYDFMNALFILMLIQNITYLDIVLLSRMITIKKEFSMLIAAFNVGGYLVYFCRNKLKKFKMINLISLVAVIAFALMSNGIELLFIDLALLIYLAQQKIKISWDISKLIDGVYIALLVVGAVYFAHSWNNLIVVINYGISLIYVLYVILQIPVSGSSCRCSS